MSTPQTAAFIALGANLGDPLTTLRWAVTELRTLGTVKALSRFQTDAEAREVERGLEARLSNMLMQSFEKIGGVDYKLPFVDKMTTQEPKPNGARPAGGPVALPGKPGDKPIDKGGERKFEFYDILEGKKGARFGDYTADGVAQNPGDGYVWR